VSVIYSI